MKLILTTIVTIFIGTISFSQAPIIEWQKTYGGSFSDAAASIKQTNDGGYVFIGTSVSGNGSFPNSQNDVLVVKLNSLGNLEWYKNFGGSNADTGATISLTSDGGFIVSAITDSNDGDITGNNGMTDGWVLKLDSSGNLQWQKAIGGSQQDGFGDIKQTIDGGYIAIGFSQSIDGDVGGNNGSADFWVVKLNSNGVLQWENNFGGSNFERATSVDQTLDGGYVIAGTTYSNDGDISIFNGSNDCWIVKIDPFGNLLWEKTIGGTAQDNAFSVKKTSDGGCIIGATTLSNNGVYNTNQGNSDCLIVKLDSLGNIQWQKLFGGQFGDSTYAIHQTNDSGFLFVGKSNSTNGDVTGNNGSSDFWVVKINFVGNIEWQKSMGGSDIDIGYALDLTTDGGAIISGSARSDDGDLNVNYGRQDIWIVKLSCLDSSFDLLIKDSFDDTGIEPNATSQNMWTSPDIWIRNNDDNGLRHQNPEFKSNNQPNYIYVKVKNNSCLVSNSNATLTLNWAKANTALAWPQNWDGSLQNNNGFDLGGALAPINIPTILPYSETIVKIPWIVPNPLNYQTNSDPWHFCLLGRINSSVDNISYPFTSNPNVMVRNNNNLAWKNITIVDLVTETNRSATVGVSSISNEPVTYILHFVTDNDEIGKPLFEEAEILVEMDEILYSIWEAGGKVSNNLKQTEEPNKIIVEGNNAYIGNLLIEPETLAKLNLKINFLTEELTSKNKFVYHIIQEIEDNREVVGGETYHIIKDPSRESFYAITEDVHEAILNEPITITANDILEPAIYNWYDEKGKLIFQGKNLSITANIAKKYKLEVIAISDGFKDYSEVEIEIKTNNLKEIVPNPVSNNVNIKYKVDGINSAYLIILGNYGSNISNNYILNLNDNNITLDLSSYPTGHYTVALVCDGNIVDASALIKN